ncbi:MAG: hypothetical protein PHT33_12890, partial [bacterium]|nr:hypothetical protein [bacterium]
VDNIWGRHGFAEGSGNHHSEPVACKLASSTAHQRLNGTAGRVISEAYAITQRFYKSYTTEDMRQLVDWQAALGVNLFLAVGLTSSHPSPNFLNDIAGMDGLDRYSVYTGRLSFALTRGIHRANIGVLFPTSTYWMRNNRTFLGDQCWKEMEKGLNDLSLGLLQNQLDFDYIFEPTLLNSPVREGRLAAAEEKFSTIVVPPVDHLVPEAGKKLDYCRENGCRVIYFDPSGLAGEDTVTSLPELTDALDSERSLRIECPNGNLSDILYHQRTLPDKEIYFISNTGPSAMPDTSVTLTASGRPEEWDLYDGKMCKLQDHAVDGSSIKLRLSFQPCQSHLIVVTK